MKTNEQMLKFYGVEMGKEYRITKIDPQGFRNEVGETFLIVKGERHVLIYFKNDNRFYPIYELNFYDYEERKDELLDEKEKEYLNAVIKPFKKRVNYIVKTADILNKKRAYFIAIHLNDGGEENFLCFPDFYAEANMYIKLKPGIKYTLKDLGLDE